MTSSLTGSPFPVELAPGVTLTAPGVVGTATLRPGERWGGEYRGPEESTGEFLAALGEAEFRQSLGVLIDTAHIDEVFSGSRTVDGEPAMVLSVPSAGDDEAQVAMCVDEFGIVTWHLPDVEQAGIIGSRAGGTVTFTVDRGDLASSVDPRTDGDRGLVAAIGKKLISVLVVPLLERAVGQVAVKVAERYERRNRRQGLLRLTSQGWTGPDDAFENWPMDVDLPVLLFVHGTASSTAGFRSLGGGTLTSGTVLDDTLAQLQSTYQGQVFAFDHHTLSADLDANVALFRSSWPTARRRPVDIVTHSRGGLVARALASSMTGPDQPLVTRRIVYVATPNGGTALADPATTRTWINRMTTLLNLIPDGPWSVVTETLGGVLTAVRVLASGAVGGLPGLAAMSPTGKVIERLPVPPATVEQYAISVDFEPQGRLLHWLRGADLIVDKVFGDVANDGVVPSDQVADVPNSGLLVPETNRRALGRRPDVWHCSVFTDPSVHSALTGWLRP